MLSVAFLYISMFNVITLSVVITDVVMLNVVMLSVVAPSRLLLYYGRNKFCTVIHSSVGHCQSLSPKSDICGQGKDFEGSPARNSIQVSSSSLACIHDTRIEVTGSDKH